MGMCGPRVRGGVGPHAARPVVSELHSACQTSSVPEELSADRCSGRVPRHYAESLDGCIGADQCPRGWSSFAKGRMRRMSLSSRAAATAAAAPLAANCVGGVAECNTWRRHIPCAAASTGGMGVDPINSMRLKCHDLEAWPEKLPWDRDRLFRGDATAPSRL